MLDLKRRFGAIGIREVAPPRQGGSTMEIVLYHQNQYHGMLEEYLSSGWVDSGSCISHGSLSLQKSIFSEYETSYAVALVHLESGSASSRLESVADHLLFLPEGEHSNFFEACLHADIALLRAQP